MITMVAPIAMMAKKLASVSVCTSVFGFQKLFTSSPVRRSTCEPASAMSAIVSKVTTITSPVSCEASSRRTMAGPRGAARSAVASAMGKEIRPCGEERLSEAHVGLRVVLVGVRIRNFEWRARERLARRRREIRERTGTDRGEERRPIGGTLLAIHRGHWQAEDLTLQPPEQCTLRASAGEQQVVRRQTDRLQDGERVAQGEADPLEHRPRQMCPSVRQAESEHRTAGCGVAV